MLGYIYSFTNIINGKKYVGQTTNIENRKLSHFAPSSKCLKFANAIKKYGKDSFEFEILETIEHENSEILRENLNVLEISYIEKFDSFSNGYNLTPGGNQTNRKGVPLSEEHKQKISNYMKHRVVSAETRLKMSAHQIGKIFSDETKQKIKEKLKGREFSQEHRKNISKSLIGRPTSEKQKETVSKIHKGKILSDETKSKISKSIRDLKLTKYLQKLEFDLEYIKQFLICIDSEILEIDDFGNVVKNFKNLAELVEFYNCRPTKFYKHFTGLQKKCYNKVFKFLKDL